MEANFLNFLTRSPPPIKSVQNSQNIRVQKYKYINLNLTIYINAHILQGTGTTMWPTHISEGTNCYMQRLGSMYIGVWYLDLVLCFLSVFPSFDTLFYVRILIKLLPAHHL